MADKRIDVVVPRGVMRLLRRIEASEDGEVVYEKGGGWWVDDHRTSGRSPRAAISLMLIGCDELHGFGGAGMERWTINETGREALKRDGVVGLPEQIAVFCALNARTRLAEETAR